MCESENLLPNLSELCRAMHEKYFEYEGKEGSGALFFISFDDIYRFDIPGATNREEQVLPQIVERLDALRGAEDFLAYLGNDNFVFVRHGIEEIREVEEMARRLLHCNADALAVEGELFYLNLAVGIALYPFDSRQATELVRLGENAMREARRNGWNRYAFYHNLESRTRIDMLEDLRKTLPEAIEKEEIRFVFQPQYCLSTRSFVGAEMLVRWRHPRYGEVSPQHFLPMAEQSGMIRYITMRALTQASKTFDRLSRMGRENFSLSINLSPLEIFHRDFLENMEFFMTHYGLKGRPLNLEITENALAHNMEVMQETLGMLKTMGFGIEIDDYGTGYTSLSTLIELPVDRVKIDRQFVGGIDRQSKTRMIFQAMMQTAEALGLEVVAEGVETKEEKRYLEETAPVVIQGWYCSRPVEEQELLKILSRGERCGGD